jgi:hypothetical protein
MKPIKKFSYSLMTCNSRSSWSTTNLIVDKMVGMDLSNMDYAQPQVPMTEGKTIS